MRSCGAMLHYKLLHRGDALGRRARSLDPLSCSHEEIVVGWLALMVMGVGVGFVQHGLRHHSHTSKWQWEPGEGWACGFLTANVLLMHTSSIVRAIAAAVRRAEARGLGTEPRGCLGARPSLVFRGWLGALHIFLEVARSSSGLLGNNV